MPGIGLILKAAFGAILSALGKLLLIWEAFRKGEQAQAQKDQSATLDAVIRERDATERAPSTPEDVAKDAKEGRL